MEEIKMPSGNDAIDKLLESDINGLWKYQITSELRFLYQITSALRFMIEKHNELVEEINKLKKGE